MSFEDSKMTVFPRPLIDKSEDDSKSKEPPPPDDNKTLDDRVNRLFDDVNKISFEAEIRTLDVDAIICTSPPPVIEMSFEDSKTVFPCPLIDKSDDDAMSKEPPPPDDNKTLDDRVNRLFDDVNKMSFEAEIRTLDFVAIICTSPPPVIEMSLDDSKTVFPCPLIDKSDDDAMSKEPPPPDDNKTLDDRVNRLFDDVSKMSFEANTWTLEDVDEICTSPPPVIEMSFEDSNMTVFPRPLIDKSDDDAMSKEPPPPDDNTTLDDRVNRLFDDVSKMSFEAEIRTLDFVAIICTSPPPVIEMSFEDSKTVFPCCPCIDKKDPPPDDNKMSDDRVNKLCDDDSMILP